MTYENHHFTKIEDIKSVVSSIPQLNYQDLSIKENEIFYLESESYRIEKLTLNPGSILEIRTDIYNVSALSIGEIILTPSHKGGGIRFASASHYELDGKNGNDGRDGQEAQGRSGKGGNGENGGDGEDGETILNRGALWLTVEKLTITPSDRPIDRAALFIDAKGIDGGKGGFGGSGGDGANGGRGGNGSHRCGVINCWCSRSNKQSGSGGNGGYGGLPGNGGGAGNGGEIHFTGPKDIFNKLILVTDVSKGEEGEPGRGGKCGNKGVGGPSHHGGRTGGCRGKQAGENGSEGVDRSTVLGSIKPSGVNGKFVYHDVLNFETFLADIFKV